MTDLQSQDPPTSARLHQRRLPLTERLALSVEEAGTLLGISRDLAYDLVARGELPSVRLGRRLVVPRVALEETLARLSEAG
jgi:excisionase family DNA binding protein